MWCHLGPGGRRSGDSPGTLCTVAGDAGIGLGKDGVSATSSSLYFPQDVGFDDDGNLVIVDFNNHRIRRVIDGVVGLVVGHEGVPGDGPEGDIERRRSTTRPGLRSTTARC